MDFKTIYASQAEAYQRMIDFEDYQGHLLPALAAIRPLDGLDVVEFGAGTGRLTVLLAPLVGTLRAFDASAHMLALAEERLGAIDAPHVQLAVADNARLPVPDDCADLALEGWSFGHLTGWYPDTWRQEAARALAELERVLRPGGTALLIETLGTGTEMPAAAQCRPGRAIRLAGRGARLHARLDSNRLPVPHAAGRRRRDALLLRGRPGRRSAGRRPDRSCRNARGCGGKTVFSFQWLVFS